jgi:hypothetical protein
MFFHNPCRLGFNVAGNMTIVNRPENFLVYGKWMKEQGIDLIDCSTSGIAMV